jgi:uncharacterized protein YbcC (UPF0753/DUF2309 family)
MNMIATTELESAVEHDRSVAELDLGRHLDGSIRQISDAIAPVWPLADYVAVNPWIGLVDQTFLDVRKLLRTVSHCETLMPLAYYAAQYARGEFCASDIQSARLENGPAAASNKITDEHITQRLRQCHVAMAHQAKANDAQEGDSVRRGGPFSQRVMASNRVDWAEAIGDEIGKICAAHYDQGQASWTSPWKHLSLFSAWKRMASIDRTLESLGMTGLRSLVEQLPDEPKAAMQFLLERSQIPVDRWPQFVMAVGFANLGWSAWAQYVDNNDEIRESRDFVGLLAIRMTYEVALAEASGIRTEDWQATDADPTHGKGDDDLGLRYLLLRASEIGFRRRLLGDLTVQPAEPTETNPTSSTGLLAQMVFCIDVRSERIRRGLESTSSGIETFGFAGFFGMPIESVALGSTHGTPQLPVLLKAAFQVREGVVGQTEADDERVGLQRRRSRSIQQHWRGLQTSAIGCFSFVETTGLWFGWRLLRRALGKSPKPTAWREAKVQADRVGPSLRGLKQQGIGVEQWTDLAEKMLKNLGLRSRFAPLVVLVGHACQTENNPLAAGLDCGACGGHSGEPNARFAAMLLNHPDVRRGLQMRGIEIPEQTYFLAGLHNTTTDQIRYFDTDQLPASHRDHFDQLAASTETASQRARIDRLPTMKTKNWRDLLNRSRDWSEVRPEWGLAGNAAFIVAPRSMTQNANLAGRAFLHSYDHHQDADGKVLELIMTAPMIVANWINMQYYASVVDNQHFGSGTKTIHNVVGRFGILSGNSGDLRTGLPWQSLHDGGELAHHPLRLQVVIAAPLSKIDRVVANHPLVSNLLRGGWLHLVAISGGETFSYGSDGQWNRVD